MSIIGMPALNVSPSTRVVDLIGRYEHCLADEVAPLEAGLAEQAARHLAIAAGGRAALSPQAAALLRKAER